MTRASSVFTEASRLWGEDNPDPIRAVMDPDDRTRLIADYLLKLQSVGADIELPFEDRVSDSLAYALLNVEAPLADRREHANQALDMARGSILNRLPAIRGVDIAAVHERSEGMSLEVVENMMELASSYPTGTGEISVIRDQLASLLFPEDRKTEDQLVATFAMLRIVQPYMVDRLLHLDIFDIDSLPDQLLELRKDLALMQRLYRSVTHLVEFSLTGKTSKSDEEIADQLFDIGPVFVQLGQSFTSTAEKEGKGPSSTLMGRIGKALQEGVSMPTESQQDYLLERLPAGLELVDFFSSAKIAYVAHTTAEGADLVTKIKRPNSEQAVADSARMLSLMSGCIVSFVYAYSGERPIAKNISVMERAVPFALDVSGRDMMRELDFERERSMQYRGAAVFEGSPGIHIPRVVERYSDENHITMEPMPGVRIDAAPANRGHLKNAMVLLLKGRKDRFMHGDMHAGNVKASPDNKGDLIVYDWGLSIEIPEEFEANLIRFLFSIVSNRPKKIADAYLQIQSPRYNQVSHEEAEEVAREAIEAMLAQRASERKGDIDGYGSSKASQKVKEVNAVFKNFIGIMGMKHQSILDTRYTQFIRSAVSLKNIVSDELSKPEYDRRRHKSSELLKSMLAALWEVYVVRE
jgi:predicted unusual protein kinase regulating ubiquinone biosynthesis (AarF/ABC1/UbiB family)